MHLTVEFLGEIQKRRVDLIKKVMDGLKADRFTLNLTQIGYFKRSEGNICWLGIEDNKTLMHIHHKLHQNLTDNGFALEDRAYKPHITLGRKVKLKDSFNANELNDMIRKINIDINSVDLMKSEFVNGRLIHSVVYTKALC